MIGIKINYLNIIVGSRGNDSLVIPVLRRNQTQKTYVSSTVFYIDINSLYPFAAKATLPAGPSFYKKYAGTDTLCLKDLKSFMGYFYIEFVTLPDLKLLPVLPRKHPGGYNVYALGWGEGWYYCKEVVLAIKMGYKVIIKESIQYASKSFLKRFVDDLYNQRRQYPKGHSLNLLYKDILNSTSFGRFAIKSDNPILKKVYVKSESEGDEVIQLYRKNSEKSLKSIIAQNAESKRLNQIDVKNNLGTYNTQAELKQLNNSIQIASAITAQARVTMYHFLEPLYRNNILLYTDTDSIFYEVKKRNKQVSLMNIINKRLDNDKIGFFKIERKSDKALFLAPKFYVTLTNDAQEIKCKGLTVQQLKQALKSGKNGSEPIIAAFEQTLENEGVLTIHVKDVERLQRRFKQLRISPVLTEQATYTNLNVDKYRKKKIINNAWIDTITLILDINYKPINLKNLKTIHKSFNSNIVS